LNCGTARPCDTDRIKELEAGCDNLHQYIADKDKRIKELEKQHEVRDELRRKLINDYEKQIELSDSVVIANLKAQLEAVKRERDNWQHHLVSDLDAGFWNAINLCTDGINKAIGEGE
jgi:predicted RNase H-like nuclease (RuvC/YqgF family)